MLAHHYESSKQPGCARHLNCEWKFVFPQLDLLWVELGGAQTCPRTVFYHGFVTYWNPDDTTTERVLTSSAHDIITIGTFDVTLIESGGYGCFIA